MAFEYDRLVKRRIRLRLELSLPGEHQALIVTGSTRWCLPLETGNFRVGVRFDPFDEDTHFDPRAFAQAISQLPPALD